MAVLSRAAAKPCPHALTRRVRVVHAPARRVCASAPCVYCSSCRCSCAALTLSDWVCRYTHMNSHLSARGGRLPHTHTHTRARSSSSHTPFAPHARSAQTPSFLKNDYGLFFVSDRLFFVCSAPKPVSPPPPPAGAPPPPQTPQTLGEQINSKRLVFQRGCRDSNPGRAGASLLWGFGSLAQRVRAAHANRLHHTRSTSYCGCLDDRTHAYRHDVTFLRFLSI